MKINNKIIGFTAAALAASSYGTSPLFAIPLLKNGVTPPAMLVYRFVIGALLLAVVMKMKKQNFSLNKIQILWICVQGGFLGTSALTMFSSFQYLDGGLVATLLFVYPAMTALLMAAFFREKLTVATISGLAAAMAGVFLLEHGSTDGKVTAFGLFLVTASALTYALYIITIKQTPLRELPAEKLTFYSLLASLPLQLAFLRGGADIPLLPNALSWGCAVGLALLSCVLSFVMTAVAVKYVGPTATSIFGALEPVTAIIIGCTVFAERFSGIQSIGILLILASVMIIISGQRKKPAPALPAAVNAAGSQNFFKK